MTVPANWPGLAAAVGVALLAAYVVAALVGRVAQTLLRAVIADPQLEARLVDRPRRIVRVAIFLITAVALLLPALKLAGYRARLGGEPEALARWLLDRGLRIGLIAVAAYIVIRIGSAATGRFEREMSRGGGLDVIERTKRARTLATLVHKALTAAVVAMAALMILRELDVDITPVLTGAGIAGLAVGFGAQTLVRDIISGFFMILEDQIRVGDVAVVNGQGGLVEGLNLRTIVLRDAEGTVHVFPNGEVKTLANRSKDFSYYVVDIPIHFDDSDRMAATLRDAAARVMQDERFASHILAPLEVIGVDAFTDSHAVLKARIKTVPLKQWEVGRELRKQIGRLFVERGIEMPASTINVKVDGLDEILRAAAEKQGAG